MNFFPFKQKSGINWIARMPTEAIIAESGLTAGGCYFYQERLDCDIIEKMLEDFEYCTAGPRGLGYGTGHPGVINDRNKGPWAVTPTMMRAWRQVNTRVVELYQYMHLIFGTATYAPAPPSSHIQHTADAIFELLDIRRKHHDLLRKSNKPIQNLSEQVSTTSELLGKSNQQLNNSREQLPEITKHEAVLAKDCELLGEVEPQEVGDDNARRRHQHLMEVQEAEAWRSVKNLLQECSNLDTLLQVSIDEGPNVLLTCVLQDDQDVLQLLIDEGVDLNQPHCTLPLHLAASLGNLPIVQTLLDAGANPALEAGMCHPGDHTPIRHVPSRFHFLETDIFICDSNHQLALMYAIENDHVETVQCLLEFGKGPAKESWPYHRYPLHYACSHGASDCVKYLVCMRPKEINTVDEEGLTPLLHAVQWGHALVKFLVESGANVHARTRRNNRGALHLLYSSVKNPLELHSTSKFLLGTGMEQDINYVDAQGNSPLHDLIAQVNRIVGKWTGGGQDAETGNQTELERQARFDDQVIHTIDLLLSFNCDPNIFNSSGVTALHKLLLSLDFVLGTDHRTITMETLTARQQHKADFSVACRALQVILKHGANSNALTTASRGPLIIMLQMLVNMDTSMTGRYSDGYLRCLVILLQGGAQPSLNLHTHLNIVATMTKYGHRCLHIRSQTDQDAVSDMLKSVLTLLLKYGLNSNHSTHGRKTKYLECTSGNILVETVKLAAFIRQPNDLLRVHSWVLSLLQGGADPDVEPYPSDPIICHSQGSIFLKPKGTQAVNQYMYDIQDFSQIFDGGLAEMLLLLFFNTMDHDALYQCMNTAKFLSRFDPNRAPSGRFLQLIHTLSSRPRSLRQIARVTIYKSIDRQLSERVPHLPLPKPLQQYLLNIE